MKRDQPVKLSLTGNNSHTVNIDSGQGNFNFGPQKLNERQDAIINENDSINWDTLKWVRWFYYTGNDNGFIEWSKKRTIEKFCWTPCKSVKLNLKDARINKLEIEVKNNIEIEVLNLKTNHLEFSGHINNIKILNIPNVKHDIVFNFSKVKHEKSLPFFDKLSEISSITIYNNTFGKPFDCKNLLQFQKLKSINLSGNLINLEVLSQFDLEKLEIRYCPNLNGLGSLNEFKKLKYIIFWNIEEGNGKKIRKEFNQLKKEREFDYCSINKLRKPIWFLESDGFYFSGWIKKNERTAKKAYKELIKEVKTITTKEQLNEVIMVFVNKLNLLKGMETTEREDVGDAIYNLKSIISKDFSIDEVLGWFHELRNF